MMPAYLLCIALSPVAFAVAADAPSDASAPNISAPAPVLRQWRLEDAVEQALMHHPLMATSQSQRSVAQAQALEARAVLLPSITATGAYQRQTSNYVLQPGSLPTSVQSAGTNQKLSNTSYNYFAFKLAGQQLIYDFGQSLGSWSRAQQLMLAQDSNVLSTRRSVTLTVRMAFFDAVAKRELRKVAQDTFDNQARHKAQTEGFVQAGTQATIALAQASTDYANSQVALITADNNYALARATLNQAMGREDDLDYDVVAEELGVVDKENAPLSVMLEEALANRPEFATMLANIRAQDQLLRSYRGTFGPSLNAIAQVTEAGSKIESLGWNWLVGVNLSWPLFTGGLNYNQISEAQAALMGLHASASQLRQQVRLEVEQARLGVLAASATQGSANEALRNAQKLLDLAEGRYQTGVGSIIELGDAQIARTNAAGQLVQAKATLAQARATLIKALGRSD